MAGREVLGESVRMEVRMPDTPPDGSASVQLTASYEEHAGADSVESEEMLIITLRPGERLVRLDTQREEGCRAQGSGFRVQVLTSAREEQGGWTVWRCAGRWGR